MAPWSDELLVHIDETYDRENADHEGGSRYGDYLKLNLSRFRDTWTTTPAPIKDPVEFAVAAWEIASSPIMNPGYVRVRPDLFSVDVRRDEWDGGLFVDVTVPLRQYHLQGPRLPYEWRDWETSSYGIGEYKGVEEPGEDGVTKAILTSALLRVPGRHWADLVTATVYEGPELAVQARQAVSVVARHINAEAGPMVASLLNAA